MMVPEPAEDTQHLEAQRRHALALRIHDHRHAPHDAVALGYDGEQATPGSRLFQHLDVTQQPRELENKRVRIFAEHGKSGNRQFLVEVRVDRKPPGFAEHHPRLADGVGENPVVARQRPQLLPRRLVETAEIIGGDVGIEPVGFREDDVERDDHGAHPGQSADDVRQARARPRPLTEPGVGKALLVDIDDGDRPRLLDPGVDALEGIEGSDAQLLDRSRVEQAQAGETDQQDQTRQARETEFPRKPPPQYS